MLPWDVYGVVSRVNKITSMSICILDASLWLSEGMNSIYLPILSSHRQCFESSPCNKKKLVLDRCLQLINGTLNVFCFFFPTATDFEIKDLDRAPSEVTLMNYKLTVTENYCISRHSTKMLARVKLSSTEDGP